MNTARNIVVNMRRLHHAAVWLVDKCPGAARSGGRFYHNPLGNHLPNSVDAGKAVTDYSWFQTNQTVPII